MPRWFLGRSTVKTAWLTGESMPVEKGRGLTLRRHDQGPRLPHSPRDTACRRHGSRSGGRAGPSSPRIEGPGTAAGRPCRELVCTGGNGHCCGHALGWGSLPATGGKPLVPAWRCWSWPVRAPWGWRLPRPCWWPEDAGRNWAFWPRRPTPGRSLPSLRPSSWTRRARVTLGHPELMRVLPASGTDEMTLLSVAAAPNGSAAIHRASRSLPPRWRGNLPYLKRPHCKRSQAPAFACKVPLAKSSSGTNDYWRQPKTGSSAIDWSVT